MSGMTMIGTRILGAGMVMHVFAVVMLWVVEAPYTGLEALLEPMEAIGLLCFVGGAVTMCLGTFEMAGGEGV